MYLLPLHIKLGSINILVKAMDNEHEGFARLRQKFSLKGESMMKEGIFVFPQIEELFENQYFSAKVYSIKKKSLEGIWKRLQKISRL
jgi:hypothetical protein